MRGTKNFLFTVLMGLIFVLAGNVSAQDLNQQKQTIIKKVHEIDKKLAEATADEYEELKKQRDALAAQLQDINAKLMADASEVQKINAVKKAYNDGNNALKLERFDEAVGHYDKAISLDKSFYQAYYGKGLALSKARKYEEAITAYKACIEENPGYDNAYIELGKLYGALGRVDNAVGIYQSAVENCPSSEKAFYQLGAVYLDKKKDYNKAAQAFSKATQIDPTYDLAYYSLGVSLTELGRYAEAINALDSALEMTNRKRWESPHYRKAVVYNKMQDYPQAIAAADEALKAKPNYAPAAYEAGKACKDLQRYDRAIAYFKIAGQDRQWKRTADYEIDLIVNRDKYGGGN